MEIPSSNNQKKVTTFKKSSLKLKIKPKNSRTINIIDNNNNNILYNTNKKTKPNAFEYHKSKTINYDEYTRKSNSTSKTKNKDFIKQKTVSSINTKVNKSSKKLYSNFDFTKFDTQNVEYNINKNLCKSTNFQAGSFLSRMQSDIKRRQSKEKQRNKILEKMKPKISEEERIKCFNRLISDCNKRNKIKENIENQNEFFSSGISPPKISKKKWDMIYENRFFKYQERIDNNLREKIIQNEKILKQREDEVSDLINSYTKKVNKKELDKIIKRLYNDSQKKRLNKKLNNFLSGQDNANGMKKEEKEINEGDNNKNNNIETINIDTTDQIRGKKQHSTIKSTKIREKKNSYFGSVIYKTLTFEQQKPNSLKNFIQNIGKSENKYEKRKEIQKEIKEIENESFNRDKIDKNKNYLKKKKKDKWENMETISDIWSNDTHIKKCHSLKRILVNDFNNPNMKFNINSNIKNKNVNKKINTNKKDNGINIINSEYYNNIDDNDDTSEIKITNENINEFVINDLKNNIKEKNKSNKHRHFNSPIHRTNYNINNIYIVDNKNNNNNLNRKMFDYTNNKNIKESKNTKNKILYERKFIDEFSAMKIVEDVFVNKIKDK